MCDECVLPFNERKMASEYITLEEGFPKCGARHSRANLFSHWADFNAAINRLCCFFFLRCGGLGVRETGRDVEGGAWPKNFGNRYTSG